MRKPSLKTSLLNLVRSKQHVLRTSLEKLHRAEQKLLKRLPLKCDYHITIESSWAMHGEVHTEFDHHGTLEDAVRLACADFIKVNKRPDDVQGTVRVFLILEKYPLPVSEEYWDHLVPRQHPKP